MDNGLGVLAFALAVAIVLVAFWRLILLAIGVATLAGFIACVAQVLNWLDSLS